MKKIKEEIYSTKDFYSRLIKDMALDRAIHITKTNKCQSLQDVYSKELENMKLTRDKK